MSYHAKKTLQSTGRSSDSRFMLEGVPAARPSVKYFGGYYDERPAAHVFHGYGVPARVALADSGDGLSGLLAVL